MIKKTLYPFMPLLLAGVLLIACKGNGQPADTVAANPVELKQKTTAQISKLLQSAMADSGRTGDTLVHLVHPGLVAAYYQ